MSPVSIMYSLRSYNAGEVGEGVLRESRVAVYGRGSGRKGCGVRCGPSRIQYPRAELSRSDRCCGAPMAAPQRPAAGPVARNSVSYKIHIRRRIKPIALAPALGIYPPGAVRLSYYPGPINPVPSSNRTHH